MVSNRLCQTVLIMGFLARSPLEVEALRIYCEDAPPFQQVKDGTVTGFSVELVRRIQQKQGNRDPIEVLPWNRAYLALQQEPDVVLIGVARTRDREPLFQWIGPVGETQYVLYVRQQDGPRVRSLEDAKRLASIGVYLNDTRDQYLTRLGFTNLVRSPDNVTNAKNLMAGRLVAYVSSREAVPDELKRAGYTESDVRPALVIDTTTIAIAFSKAVAPSVIQAWQTALDELKRDGTFAELFHQFLPGAPLPLAAAPEAFGGGQP